MHALDKFTQGQLKELWIRLGDVPVIENKKWELILDAPFLDYPKGTNVEDIWHDFDEALDDGIAPLIGDLNWTWNRVEYISDEDYEALVKMLEED